jgi:predicted transposase/invertase (TIGR01784 family)
MSYEKFLDPKNDIAFKQVFGTEKNKDILIHFLNDMIPFPEGAKIETVSFLKPSQDPDAAIRKQSIVDVLCVDEKGCQYIVEMQVASTKSFVKRAQYYAAKAYVNQMGVGEDYQNLKEIIFLAITDFVMFPDNPEYKTDHMILDKNSLEHNLKDFYFCFLELPKFKKSIHELTTPIEKWTYFFKHAPKTSLEELREVIGDYPIIEKAYNVLNQFFWSKQELDFYEWELKRKRDENAVYAYKVDEGFAKGKAEGFAKGKAEGFTEGEAAGEARGAQNAIRRIAADFLAQGIDVATIQAVTKLSPEEIESLATYSEK